jgi:hypothetical protein
MTDKKETTPLLEEKGIQGIQLTKQQSHMLQIIINNNQQSQIKKQKINKISKHDPCTIQIGVTVIILIIFIGVGIYAGIKSH